MMRRSAAESSGKSPRRECAAVSCGPARSHGIRNPIRDRGNALDKRFRLLLNSCRCLPPQRQLQIRAAAPPWFPTNLGVPAEDNRKMAGLAPAIHVFGKRAESPINLGVFEVVPSRGHRTEHRSDRCRFVVRENPERARKRPRSIEILSPAFSCVCGVASSCRAGVVRRARALALAPTTRRCGAT